MMRKVFKIVALFRSICFIFLSSLSLLPILAADTAGRPLKRFDNCRLAHTEWADGDSFLVETAEGQLTIRLYGVDCIESRVADETDARRLRSQRRYFGISEAGGEPQASIDLACTLGRKAGDETFQALQNPFTVYTAFSDARGDARYKRVYAFVFTQDGEDLAARLVRLGHARAFGVYRETPDGTPGSAYRDALRDLELQAARLGKGVWAHTDWTNLISERKLERDEELELGLAVAKSAPPSHPLDVNSASRDELMTIPGIGETIATRIIENRPYKAIQDLQQVDGIGAKTQERLADYLVVPK